MSAVRSVHRPRQPPHPLLLLLATLRGRVYAGTVSEAAQLISRSCLSRAVLLVHSFICITIQSYTVSISDMSFVEWVVIHRYYIWQHMNNKKSQNLSKKAKQTQEKQSNPKTFYIFEWQWEQPVSTLSFCCLCCFCFRPFTFVHSLFYAMSRVLFTRGQW